MTSPDPPREASATMAISNLAVHLMSDYTGRGPTQARTFINTDLVTIVVRDALTRGERALVNGGREDLVLTTRRAYQDAMRRDLASGVEQITGRQVVAFLSANHVEPDFAVESFILAPVAGAPGAERAAPD